MIHDPALVERLSELPTESFKGTVFRATRSSLDPLASSYNGGRWMVPNSAPALYTSLVREGALAEISFHWSLQNPLPTKPVLVHRLNIAAERVLKILRTDLGSLGISEDAYLQVNQPRAQEVGAAAEFLGFDGILAPSARWPCENLILFTDRMVFDSTLDLESSETVDWQSWARANGMLGHKLL